MNAKFTALPQHENGPLTLNDDAEKCIRLAASWRMSRIYLS